MVNLLITLAVLSCDPLTINLSFGETSNELISCNKIVIYCMCEQDLPSHELIEYKLQGFHSIKQRG